VSVSLAVPNLDDRRFQDILDDARRMIPRFCPEWTDHNLSDPGITLLELYAWMTDLLLFRLNQVPERNYVKFLELIGVQLEPARPASAEILFRLTAPQADELTIPRGTSVATLRGESEESAVFTTDADLIVRTPRLTEVLLSGADRSVHDYQAVLGEHPYQSFSIFSNPPAVDDCLYLGFSNDLAGHTLAISFSCPIAGLNIDPDRPPRVWEARDRRTQTWEALDVELDATRGFNQEGVVILSVPTAATNAVVGGRRAFWIRCRVREPLPGETAYLHSPSFSRVSVESIGGLVSARHGFKVRGEELGISDGSPGQRFELHTPPVLALDPDETLEVETGERGVYEAWTQVSSFANSQTDDPHFVVDRANGTVELGPRIRTPQGIEQQYGRQVPAGRRLRFTSYRSGGGRKGNVGANTLTVLKSSIPYVAWVTNLAPATGGTDTEDIEHAKWRGPQVLRARDRAVTAEDYETLALEASPAVARAHCIMVRDSTTPSATPGVVRLQLVPAVPERTGRGVTPNELAVPGAVREAVRALLDERRPLCCELVIEPAQYIWVDLHARLRVKAGASPERVLRAARDCLFQYIHPTRGGPDGGGWPFQRPLFAGELYSLLLGIAGLDTVEDLILFQVDPESGERGNSLSRVTPGTDGILCMRETNLEAANA
jgi:predicted phage baseplate assembly protein